MVGYRSYLSLVYHICTIIPAVSFLKIPILTRKNINRATTNNIEKDFWQTGLKFGCTGCGRCCTNKGEVWFNIDEFVDLVNKLKQPVYEVLDAYAEEVISGGWIKMKSIPDKTSSNEDEIEKCIFLGPDLKRCTIYENRPVQCRTYPYWPELISDTRSWESEAVLPILDTASSVPPQSMMQGESNNNTSLSRAESVEKASSTSSSTFPTSASSTPTSSTSSLPRYWTLEEGGCEGINHADAPIVLSTAIHRSHELYKAYNNEAFPYASTPFDRAQLHVDVDIIQRVTEATQRWVSEFVIGYNLCPFALNVFSRDKVRYRVFLGTDRSKIIERIKREVLDLIVSPEDTVATTLLMLPFAFPNFEEFHAFSLDLEDIILPSIERHSLSPSAMHSTGIGADIDIDIDVDADVDVDVDAVIGTTSASASSSCPKDKESNEIQMAFFHPSFTWGAEADDDACGGDDSRSNAGVNQQAALDFEKRAPFPTINLLRARKVREYASQDKTSRISDCNAKSLEDVGGTALSAHFNDIMTQALSTDTI